MKLYLLFLLCLTLRGSDSIKFLLQGRTALCFADYQGALKGDITCSNMSSSVSALDYNNTAEEAISSFLSPDLSPMEMVLDDVFFKLDWKHNKYYGLRRDNNTLLKMAPARTTDGNLILHIESDIVDDVDIAETAGCNETSIRDVRVDPYEGFLFMYVTDISSDDVFILRSSLNGEGLKLISTLSVTKEKHPNVPINKNINFCIDIGDRRFYVSKNKRTLFQYDYEGTLLREFESNFEITTYDVLGDHLYLPADYGLPESMYEISLSENESKLSMANVLSVKTTRKIPVNSPFFYIKLIDPRAQRRKRDGKYICDRTDCPELCEVLPSGDTCLCRRDKAKAREECGQSRLTSLGLESTNDNGTSSMLRELPWHATLYNATTKQQFCGGTLVSSRAVLTAAHCVTSECSNCLPTVMLANEILVSFGNTKQDWDVEDKFKITRQVNQIYVHEDFVGAIINHANDIALLLLDSEVPVSNLVMPACLDYNLNQLPRHETLHGFVAGFGYQRGDYNLVPHSKTLLYSNVSVMSFENCFQHYKLMNPHTFHMLNPDKFCIGSGPWSTIQQGDNGGGLTLQYKGLHYVTGVASVKLRKFRFQSKDQDRYGAFTDVSKHMDWLINRLPEDK